MKKIFLLLILLGFANTSYAAPTARYDVTIIPVTTGTYELGTSLKTWLTGYFDNICLGGVCKSAWPTGGGSGGASAFSTSTAWGSILNIFPNNITDLFSIGYSGSGVATSSNAEFVVDPTAKLALFLNSTKLGIGTTTPWRTFSVNGSSDLGTNALAGYFTATTSTASVFPLANITKLSNLTSNGFVKTSSADGTLSVDTNSYLTGVTADSPLSGSGTSGSHLVLSTAGTWSGNAGTATALAANGTNCSAGNYPLGVDASGNVENCTAASTGTVTAVSVASSNGFAGSSSGGATPALTLSTTITGLLKGNGTAISAAANGTDYTLLTSTTCGAGAHISAVTAAGAVTCSSDSGGGGGGTGVGWLWNSINSLYQSTTTDDVLLGASATTSTAKLEVIAGDTKPSAYFEGNVGIGTTTPVGKLAIVITATSTQPAFLIASTTNGSYASNSNIFTIANSTTTITNDLLGTGTSDLTTLFTGTLSTVDDAGVVTWTDIPISASANGTPQALNATIGGSTVLTVYGESNGSGLSKNLRVGIGSTTPMAALSVSGSTTSATSWAFAVADVASSTKFIIRDDGVVGIGTTSPFASLSLTGSSSFIPFAISSTTSTLASSTLFMVDKAGDVHYGGGTPTLSSCGTGPSLGANSTDQSGTVTVGASATGCTITFSTAKSSTPHCIVTAETMSLVNALSYTQTASALTLSQTGASGNYNYFCPLGH